MYFNSLKFFGNGSAWLIAARHCSDHHDFHDPFKILFGGLDPYCIFWAQSITSFLRRPLTASVVMDYLILKAR